LVGLDSRPARNVVSLRLEPRLERVQDVAPPLLDATESGGEIRIDHGHTAPPSSAHTVARTDSPAPYERT
jgi:hypothetical protein